MSVAEKEFQFDEGNLCIINMKEDFDLEAGLRILVIERRGLDNWVKENCTIVGGGSNEDLFDLHSFVCANQFLVPPSLKPTDIPDAKDFLLSLANKNDKLGVVYSGEEKSGLFLVKN